MIAGDMYSMDYTDYETGGSIMDQVAEFVYDELPSMDPDTFRLFEKCQNTYG
jgi:hypothetical protein